MATTEKYCGTSIPSRRIILSNKAFLHFQSDKYDTGNKGFKLDYEPYSKLY